MKTSAWATVAGALAEEASVAGRPALSEVSPRSSESDALYSAFSGPEGELKSGRLSCLSRTAAEHVVDGAVDVVRTEMGG